MYFTNANNFRKNYLFKMNFKEYLKQAKLKTGLVVIFLALLFLADPPTLYYNSTLQ